MSEQESDVIRAFHAHCAPLIRTEFPALYRLAQARSVDLAALLNTDARLLEERAHCVTFGFREPFDVELADTLIGVLVAAVSAALGRRLHIHVELLVGVESGARDNLIRSAAEMGARVVEGEAAVEAAEAIIKEGSK